jgi:hypothetical protein
VGDGSSSTDQGTEVVPHLRNVRVQANSSGVRVKSIAVLVDLVVQHTNTAPERRVAAVTIHGLLISFIGFGVFLL